MDLSRRRLVGLGITGTAVALTGCGAQLDEQSADATPDDGNEGKDTANVRSTTVVVDLDDEKQQAIQEEFQEARGEIQEAFQNEEITQEEAQDRLAEAEAEASAAQEALVKETVERIETHVEETDELSVEGVATEAGVVLVEGDAVAAIDLLSLDSVAALLPEDRFEDLE